MNILYCLILYRRKLLLKLFYSFTEDELKENQRLEQLAEQKTSCVYYKLSANHVNNVPQRRGAPHQCPLAALSPSLPPSSIPITVIPIPVVTPNPTGSPPVPMATLSPPVAPPPAAALPHSPQPPPDHTVSALTTNPKQLVQKQPLHPPLITQTNSNRLQELAQQPPVQRYPGSIVSPPRQQTLLPQAGPPLQQASLQNGPISRAGSPDDSLYQDNKKRPGG